MKKILLGMALVVYSFGAFAVDLSTMEAMVFIDDSSSYDIKGDLRDNADCDDSDYSPYYDLSGGLETIPNNGSGGIDSFYLENDDSEAVFECVTLNDDDKSDDIYFTTEDTDNSSNCGEEGCIRDAGYSNVYYSAGSSSALLKRSFNNQL